MPQRNGRVYHLHLTMQRKMVMGQPHYWQADTFQCFNAFSVLVRREMNFLELTSSPYVAPIGNLGVKSLYS